MEASCESSKYDKECLERYGEKTCIIVHKDEQCELRLLDKVRKHGEVSYVTKSSLYQTIPDLLMTKYTVVVVEYLEQNNQKEITAVHLPVQAMLNPPPLLQ
jgi:hypothetical protein